MNPEAVESMVTHLVQYSSNSAAKSPNGIGKSLVRLKRRTTYPFSCPEIVQANAPMTWTFLQKLLSMHPQNRGDFIMKQAKLQKNNNRKVLAPLAIKQNTDNIIAGNLDMHKKRNAKFCHDSAPPTKCTKVNVKLKPCSVIVKRASAKTMLLQYKYTRTKPFVKLFDILKEIPQVKMEETPVNQMDFMGSLKLLSKKHIDAVPKSKMDAISCSTKLLTHPHIPFSSDYGRRLLARENHSLSQDVVLRKLERTEWHLKGTITYKTNSQPPTITYDNKINNRTHWYNFPKRQFYQNHQSLQESFMKYLCKPLCVELETMDHESVAGKSNTRNNTDPDHTYLGDEKLSCVSAKVLIIHTKSASLSALVQEDNLKTSNNLDATVKRNKRLILKPRRSLRNANKISK